MWLLSCDGDLFGGQTKWLPPGSQHVLGRTTAKDDNGTREPRVHWINNKTVSRKHIVITVGPVKQDASGLLHTKTDIEVLDNSKMGTNINDEKIKGTSLRLTKDENTIRLGNYEHHFQLRWQPVNLSISGVGKKNKKTEKLSDYRRRLGHTDIKITAEYIAQRTTHMVSPKRNTPGCLQALVEARWIVTEGFVDALAAATTKPNGNADEAGESQLEIDFKVNWPSEVSFPIPTGNEPVQRPAELLKPDERRLGVFRDHVFVFTSQQRFEDLLPVVASGEGKALLHDAESNDLSVEKAVSYIKDVAGNKGAGNINLSQYPGPGAIVVVSSGQVNFDKNLAIALHQRLINTNEFLDAILILNTNPLHELLQYSPDNMPPASQRNGAASVAQSQQRASDSGAARDTPAAANLDSRPPSAEEEQTPRPTASVPRKRRLVTQSRFKKDIDDYDPSEFTRAPSASPEPSPSAESHAASQAMNVDEPARPSATQQSSRKRPLPDDEEDQQEPDSTASYLPAAQAFKRFKSEAAARGEENHWTKSKSKSTTPATTTRSTAAALPKKKAPKEVDVKKALAAARAKEDEEYDKDEAFKEEMKGVDIKSLRDVAKVEEMTIPIRQRPARIADQGADVHSERWDPKWNGRKNFKKFRPQGQRGEAVQRLQRVMVTLEPVEKRGHGLGAEYWLDPSASTSSRKSKSQKSQSSISQSVRQQQQPAATDAAALTSDDTGDAARFRRRIQNSYAEDADNAYHDEVLPESTAGVPRDPEIAAAASQTLRKDTQVAKSVKRPAPEQGGGAAKKARKAPAAREAVIDEDDGDELKFRRRRKA